MKNVFRFLSLSLILGLVLTSCLKEDFDQPPVDGTDPNLPVNATIKQLKDLHVAGNFETITEDWTIKGTIVADDASGNWYQAFVIQDETGGIEVHIENADSYTLFPIGREVYIKCKGLVLGDYNNLVQLGGFITEEGDLGNIINITNHIVRGVKKAPPTPKVKKINELTTDDVSTLITIENVQYVLNDTSRTYADPVTRTSYNRYLEDCTANQVIVRTSGYASFAGAGLPNGNGSFTGVLSIFRDDYQFLVRDLTDIQMEGDRCGGNGGGGNPCNGVVAPIVAGVDEGFESGANNDAVELNGWTNLAIKGSRSWQFKEFSGNVYAQATAFNDSSPEMETWMVTPRIDLTEPKFLTFETAKAFYTHDGFSVWVSTDFECDPTVATWLPITADLAGQGDADNEWVPSGDIDLTALVGQKIAIGFKYVGSGPSGQTGTFRVDNVKLGEGGGGGGPTDPCVGYVPLEVGTVDEGFEAGANNDPVAVNGWINLATAGTRTWQFKEFDSNVYCQATAFNDSSPDMATWLVTPLINISEPKTLTFESAKAFWTHDGLTVWVSTDFVCDPASATWQPLSCTLAAEDDADHAWVPSGNVDLSAYVGQKIAIGFKYVGNNSSQTTSYRIDNVLVE